MSSHVQQSIPPGLLSLLVTKYEEKSKKHAIQNLYRLQVESYKNDSGKYECPICQKSYVHFKHLRRHNRQHTGYRPHVCHICRDTFCRSDILKRHYERCFSKFIATGKLSAKSRVPKVSKEYVQSANSPPLTDTPLPDQHLSTTDPVTLPGNMMGGTDTNSKLNYTPTFYPAHPSPPSLDYIQSRDEFRQVVPRQPIYSSDNISIMPIDSPEYISSPGPPNCPGAGPLIKQEELTPPAFESYSARDSCTSLVSPVSLDETVNSLPITGIVDDTPPTENEYFPRFVSNIRKPGQFYCEDTYGYRPDQTTIIANGPRIISVSSASNDIVLRWLEPDW
ncbi:hypothetical protein AWJ20_2065 [Sugiyamaella lignohabitans]|uniref:C2H2-type domain-containing protein n=1 Tax=Sugiyamaella lignohabitans TaxID=796027 RepID=A0A167EUH0_9ASCO|nr:uncharacterized protein AWJ20_2065 [Sugiyamaella lignohabitans]ANB14473.1 hypothetical protein AWJ20_2065 [Sugiyamaella lignohabitans]